MTDKKPLIPLLFVCGLAVPWWVAKVFNPLLKVYLRFRGYELFIARMPIAESIANGAEILAHEIHRMGLKDDKFVAVGHSMGCLWLRLYIAQALQSGGGSVPSVTTFISGPHRGAKLADWLMKETKPTNDSTLKAAFGRAGYDLETRNMEAFNLMCPDGGQRFFSLWFKGDGLVDEESAKWGEVLPQSGFFAKHLMQVNPIGVWRWTFGVVLDNLDRVFGK